MHSYKIVDKVSFKNGVRVFLEHNSLEDMKIKGWVLVEETDEKLVFKKI